MMKIAIGALAALAVAAVPASAAHVGVRVEGEAQTLLPRTAVETTTAPVGKPGEPTCDGSSALGALDRATGGDWDGPYDAGFQTYSLETVERETHDAGTSSYWAFWINYTYASLGVCGQRVQEGDDLLFVPECYAQGCAPASPLRVRGLPPAVAPGAPVMITVDAYSPPVYPATETTVAPAAGATVNYGGRTATTGADGTARLTFAGGGPVTIQATRAGNVRSAVEQTCVTTGADGLCGSRASGGGAAVPPAQPDVTAPVASFTGLTDGEVFARRRAPRTIAGTTTPDPSGLLSVRLDIMRRKGGRCSAFDGPTERFHVHRCGGRRSFRIGDREDWSYLLPKRLGKGRYVIRAVVIDRKGNDAATTVRIRVR